MSQGQGVSSKDGLVVCINVLSKKKLNTRRENFIAMVKRAGKDISMGKITLGSHFATVSGSVVSAG